MSRFRLLLALAMSTAASIALSTALLLPAQLATAAPTPTPAPSDPVAPSVPAATPGSATPDPSASPTPSPTPSPTASPTPSPTPTPPKSGPAPSGSAGPPEVRVRAAAAVTLSVRALRTPVNGRFFEDIGAYGFAGAAQGGQWVTVEVLGSDRRWHPFRRVAAAADGSYSAEGPVGSRGRKSFRATTSDADPTSLTSASVSAAATSSTVSVTVSDARVTLTTPKRRVNALAEPVLRGSVVPARPGVTVNLQVQLKGHWHKIASATTAADGRYAVRFGTGTSRLATYRVRTWYRAANRVRNEVGPAATLQRVRVLDARTAATTAADVARTYRAGCPVGPSELSTITLNYWGFDHRMHRGVIIVKTSLTGRVVRSFGAALHAGMPLRRMDNPDVYDGDDPRQMEADNTSGFNCRKVVGNPYAQSPHSYGIAVDVNTVENPYRDARGRWWPQRGKAYIDRTPWKPGMLTKSSTLTRKLGREGFFWGGRWSPGRDYQHFEYDR